MSRRLRPIAGRRAGIALLLILGAVRGLAAHDFWIEPSAFETAVGSAVRVHLRVGEDFAGEPVVRNDTRIDRFFVAGPAGERPVVGRDGLDPAGLFRADAAGIWWVGYRSRTSAVTLDADAFEKYLKEEGLERVIAERARRGESRTRGREIFSRSVKSLIAAGPAAGATGCDRVLGLTLELVPERDPRAPGSLPLRLLHDGGPLEGALVVAIRRDAPRTAGTVVASTRTDRDGRVVIPTSSGTWLIKAVHMERAAAGKDADWESVWTSLTFEVRG